RLDGRVQSVVKNNKPALAAQHISQHEVRNNLLEPMIAVYVNVIANSRPRFGEQLRHSDNRSTFYPTKLRTKFLLQIRFDDCPANCPGLGVSNPKWIEYEVHKRFP